jgi:predicted metal-dependent hydrolase
VATGGNLTLKLGVLMVLFVFEVFLNGFFLAKGSELGYLGGAAEAFAFALFNIGVSFLAGAVGARELHHRNYLRKLFGLVAVLAYLALAVGLNLTLAHYREAAGSLVSDAGHEVLVRLRTAPLAIADIKSWLFFGIGLLTSLIAFGDSYLIFDPYPGYGTLEKRRASAYDAYIRRKNELIATLLEIRDEAIEILEDANRDLAIRRSEHDAILEGRNRIIRLFEAHQTHLDRTANALLSTYREANKRTRTTPPPPRFAAPYALERIPVDQDPGQASARDDLRRSIAESQAVLVEQIHAIHAEFERAFAS